MNMYILKRFPKHLHDNCNCFECRSYEVALGRLDMALYEQRLYRSSLATHRAEIKKEKPKTFFSWLFRDREDIRNHRRVTKSIIDDVKKIDNEVYRIATRMRQKLNNESIDGPDHCKCWLCISEFITEDDIKRYGYCYEGCKECPNSKQ